MYVYKKLAQQRVQISDGVKLWSKESENEKRNGNKLLYVGYPLLAFCLLYSDSLSTFRNSSNQK